MWFWLGTINLVLIGILIAMGFKQRRTLVPIFEKEPMLRDAVDVPGFPFFWLEGPFLRGWRYSIALGAIYLTPTRIVEREGAHLRCTKAEFLRHFSQSDIRRAVAFTVLALTFLVVGITAYFLMPEDAR